MRILKASLAGVTLFIAEILFSTLQGVSAQHFMPKRYTSSTLTSDTLRLTVPFDSIIEKKLSQISTVSSIQDSLRRAINISDSLMFHKKPRVFTRFVPDPKRALWLALVLPGAGQIYNRKYWKLPIIYGGFIGCTYALLWNQQMYNDYSQAYIDIMDNDPRTASYKNILPLGYDITGREDQFKTIFKHKKDFYRRYRDLSIFSFFGVYLISIIDAYVDAQLSTFDISRDLTLHFEPAILKQDAAVRKTQAVGLQCSLNF